MEVFTLVAIGATTGEATLLGVTLYEGVHGQSVERVDVAGASPDLARSAERAVAEAARILHRERYVDRQIVVRFSLVGANTIHGRSAELAFALALVNAATPFALPALAATGLIEPGGAIRRVEGVEAKAWAAVKVLPRGGRFIYPFANDAALSPELRRKAAEAGIVLNPAHRLEDLLASLGVKITTTWLDEPFRGLEPFEVDHASIFFGREAEIDELVSLLRRRSAVLVRGPSGAGKSSLTLAGLIPALLRRSGEGGAVRWALIRPREFRADAAIERELDSLRAALASSWLHEGEGGLDAGAEALLPDFDADAFAARLSAVGGEWIWVLDQLDELFDGGLRPATIEALAKFLAEAKVRGVKIVATITNSGMRLLNAQPTLASLFGIEGVYELEPRHDAKFLQAVVGGPAAAANLRFENGLDAELITAASHGGPDVLPLLELLLTELFERRDRATRELRWSDYRSVGGLDGVVSARAEAVFQSMGSLEQAQLPLLLWRLATAGSIDVSAFAADHPMAHLIAACQSRRLLARDGAEARAAHEALLRHWTRASKYLAAQRDEIDLWRDLRREAAQWRAGQRSPMPGGPQLTAAIALIGRHDVEADIDAYVAASRRQRDRRRLLIGAAASTAATAGVGWAGMAGWRAWRRSHETRIDFADLSVPGPDYIVAAEPYLNRLGVSVKTRDPETARVVIRNNLGLYSGRAADPQVGQNFLTEEVDANTAPISFTLAFLAPPRRVELMRAALWAATESGVTHPFWSMEALDRDGRPIDKQSETLLRGLIDPTSANRMILIDDYARPVATIEGRVIPAKIFSVGGGAAPDIAALRIGSDYRLGGRPFAATHAVLINELTLYYN